MGGGGVGGQEEVGVAPEPLDGGLEVPEEGPEGHAGGGEAVDVAEEARDRGGGEPGELGDGGEEQGGDVVAELGLSLIHI